MMLYSLRDLSKKNIKILGVIFFLKHSTVTTVNHYWSVLADITVKNNK